MSDECCLCECNTCYSLNYRQPLVNHSVKDCECPGAGFVQVKPVHLQGWDLSMGPATNHTTHFDDCGCLTKKHKTELEKTKSLARELLEAFTFMFEQEDNQTESRRELIKRAEEELK